MLDYRIITFLTLCEKMNYRKTAEALNMTQPGVTQHIHYLEGYYGVKLFEYDGRTLKKTKAATVLKKHMESMMAEEKQIALSLTPQKGVSLNVGATKTIGEFVVLPMIHSFLSSGENTINLTVDNTEKLLEMLDGSQIDFAIIEGVFDKESYGYHLFKKEGFVGVCAKSHRFAGKRVTLAEAFKEGIVVREKGSGTRRLLEQAINDRGFSLDSFKRCVSVSSFSVLCDLVAGAEMISFAYEPVARSRDDLDTFEIKDMEIVGEFNYVYCNEKIAKEKIKDFLEK